MALATYADLIAGIRDWLARPGDTASLPDARLADLVVAAETAICDRYRGREMVGSATISTTAQTVPLPADFLEARRLYLDASPLAWLEYRAPPQFWREFAANVAGRPRCFTIEGTSIVFGPVPDAVYTGRLSYFERFDPLATALNPLYLARPTLYLYGALAHAAPLIGADERLPLWQGLFEKALAEAQMASDRALYGGSPLAMRPG